MTDRYRPTGVNKKFAEIMDRARHTNRERNRTDKACDIPVPRDCGPAIYLSAAISAIETGVMTEDWDPVAEGLAMLEDLRAKYAIVLGGRKAPRQEASV